MITLHFKVDPTYLVYYTLTRCAPDCFIPGQPVEHIVAFQNRAWDADCESYSVLRHGISDKFILSKKPIAELAMRTDKFLQAMALEPLFIPVFNDTMSALAKARDEWESNLQQSHDIMTENTGLNLTKELDVYITHPSQGNGVNMDDVILWTYRLDFPNYNTVYLWHEIMHSFIIPTDRANDELTHSVIELLTDQELRVRLNGGSYPPFIGHNELKILEEKLLPRWRSYLEQPKKEIAAFIQESIASQSATIKED